MEQEANKILMERYKILSRIGKGRSGTIVEKAIDIQENKEVRIKIIPPILVSGNSILEQLRNEAQTAKRVCPDGVVGLMDSKIEEDGTWLLVTEYFEGKTLSQIIDEEIRLNYKKIFSYLIPICRTLEAIHKNGVIHRDLKPENILVCDGTVSGENVKIMDFGMALLWESFSSSPAGLSGIDLVPPYYFAPEQINKTLQIDPRLDLYSLGVVLYQTIVGKVPFDDEKYDGIKTKIISTQPQHPRHINPDIPEEISSLIMCAMDKDPDMRFQGAGDLLAVIKNIIEVLGARERGEEEESFSGTHDTLRLEPATPQSIESALMEKEEPEDVDELISALSSQMENAQTIEEKVEAGKKLAAIYENKLFDSEMARDIYLKLLELNPKDPWILDELERIHLINLDWQSLLTILEKKEAIAKDESELTDILLKKAEILTQQIGNAEGAFEILKKITDEIDPFNAKALEELKALCMQMQKWNEYLEIAGRLIPLSDDETKVKLYEELASIWIEKFNNIEEGKKAYQNILKIQPDNRIIASILEDIMKREPMEGEATVPGAPFPEPPATVTDTDKFEMTTESIKGSFAPAETIKASALPPIPQRSIAPHIPPPPPPPRREESKPAEPPPAPSQRLPRSVQHEIPSKPAEEDEKNLEWLKDIGDPEGTIQQLLDEYEKEKLISAKVQILVKTAKIYEKLLGDEESAFLLLIKAFLENPQSASLVEEVEKLAGRLGKWEELISAANDKIVELGNRAEAVPLYLQVGKWYQERLGNIQYAMAIYTKASQIDPQNIDALSAIADIYRLLGQWESYIHYLKIQLDKVRTEEARIKILVNLAKAYIEDLKNIDLGVETFQKVLSKDPLNEVAITYLEPIYRERQMFKELADILRKKLKKLDPAQQTTETIKVLLELAGILHTSLGDTASAVECYRKVIEIDHTNLEALRFLEIIFTELDQTNDLIDILEMELEATPIEKQKVEILHQIATLYERKLLQLDIARQKYEQILVLDPDNIQAFENLERHYRNQKNWTSLLEILQRHASASDDKDTKVQLLLEAGIILETEFASIERALEIYRQAIEIDPQNPQVLEKVAVSNERMRNFVDACKSYESLSKVTLEPSRKADFLYKMALILDKELGRRDESIVKLTEAISTYPEHLDSLGALRTIYIEMQDWHNAQKIIEIEENLTTDLVQKSQLAYARGRILMDYLGKTEEAIALFKKALELSPDNDEAARPLSKYYIQNEKWEEARQMLDLIYRKKTHQHGTEEIYPYMKDLASISSLLGDDQKAVTVFKECLSIKPEDVDVLKALADALYRIGSLDEAFNNYALIVKNYPETQTKREKIEIYYRMGEIKIRQNEPRKALKLLEGIIEIDPRHEPTLQLLAETFSKYGDWEQVVYFKKLLAEISPPEKQKSLYEEIGDIWYEKLQGSIKAIAMYNEVLKLDPNNVVVLHKLVKLYSETKQWLKAVEVIKQIAELESDMERKSRYYGSIAIIYQSEIKEIDRAVEYFNKALDADPGNLKNFEAIEKLLTPARDWKNLEKNYRAMIHRIKGTGNKVLEETLLHNLGEIYRTRMKNYEAAIEAFKLASALSPDNLERHEILAELYQMLPEKWEDAARELQFLLRKDPGRVDFYRALWKIYHHNELYDRCFCTSAALVMMNQSNEEERAFYEMYRNTQPPIPQQMIDNENWIKNIVHPMENPFVEKIFEIMIPVFFRRKAKPQKSYDLKKKDKRDPFSAPEPIVRALGAVSKIFGLPLPEIYVMPEQPVPLLYAVTDPPASIIGGPLVAMNFPPHDLLFIAAKHMTYYRGGHYMRLLEPTIAGLTSLLYSALKIANPAQKIPPEIEKQIAPVVQILVKELNPFQLEQLTKSVKGFITSGETVDLKKWEAGVELTACRAAMAACNNLESAIRMINSEPPGISDLPPKEKVKEMFVFSCSDQYFRLRELTGVTIKIPE